MARWTHLRQVRNFKFFTQTQDVKIGFWITYLVYRWAQNWRLSGGLYTSVPSSVFIHPAVWPQWCRMPLAA